MAFCGNCGAQLADGVKFCTNCGEYEQQRDHGAGRDQ